MVKPLNNWERITPELPLAPLKEPLDIALARLSMSGVSILLTSFDADIIVSVILVPVSPSGTGKTFKSLIHSFLASRLAAPARKISLTIPASILVVVTLNFLLTSESY